MDYQDMKDEIADLGFIRDDEQADAAIRAVLGVVTSKLEDDDARDFTDKLPGELDYHTLHGAQSGPSPTQPDELVAVVANRMGIKGRRARRLIEAVLSSTRDGIGDRDFDQMCSRLPTGWQDLVRDMSGAVVG